MNTSRTLDVIYRRNPQFWKQNTITYDDLVEEMWQPKGPTENETAADFKNIIEYWSDPFQGFSVRYGFVPRPPNLETTSVINFHQFTINNITYKDYVFRPQFMNECMAYAYLCNEHDMPSNCPQYESEHQAETFNDHFYQFFLAKWLPLLNYWWMASWSDADKFALLGGLMSNGVRSRTKKAADSNEADKQLMTAITSNHSRKGMPEPLALSAWFPSIESVLKFRSIVGEPFPPFLVDKINILFSPQFHKILNARLYQHKLFKQHVRTTQDAIKAKRARDEEEAAAAAKRARVEEEAVAVPAAATEADECNSSG